MWLERGERDRRGRSDRVKGGVAARYHCGTAKVEAIPRISLSRFLSLFLLLSLSSSLFLFPSLARSSSLALFYPLVRYPSPTLSSVTTLSLALLQQSRSAGALAPRAPVRARYSKRPTAFARYLPPKSTRGDPLTPPPPAVPRPLLLALIRPIPQDPSRGSTDCAL